MGLLSVVVEKDGEVVHIHADEAGLEQLAVVIERLRVKLRQGQHDHEHLFTEAWAGHELTESMFPADRAAGAIQVHHVKIHAWTKELSEL
ncbi:MAG: immunity protein 32 [Chloroflexi bacterium]|nr:immunity protein 32 [Chloroflexota bacterium]